MKVAQSPSPIKGLSAQAALRLPFSDVRRIIHWIALIEEVLKIMRRRAEINYMNGHRIAALLLLTGIAKGETMAQEELFVEGFARPIAANSQGDYASNRGIQAPSSWEYAIDGTQQVEWESAPVPAAPGAARVTLVWACGLSRQPGPHQLRLNGEEVLSFESGALPEEKSWPRGDCTLRFQPMLRDFSGDVHGIMYLSVPAARLEPGQPARLPTS